MADVARIMAEVTLEADQAIQQMQKFGKTGVAELRAIGKAANQANAEMMKTATVAGRMQQAYARTNAAIATGFEKLSKNATQLGATLSARVTLPLTLLARKAVTAFREQEMALVQLRNAYDQTGENVGVSIEEMIRFSETAQKKFGVADDAINQMQVTLLKFQNVTGDVFRRAQQVAIDYAARTGTEIPAAAETLGRALEDPTRGMMLLRRAGIILSEEQQALVKSLHATGQTAKAQDVILKELEGTYGGAAAAAAATDLGKFNIAMQRMGEVLEQVGGIIAPIITKLADALATLLELFTALPEGVQQAIIALFGMAAAAGALLFALGPLGPAFAVLAAGIAGFAAAQGGFTNFVINVLLGLAQIAQALGNTYDGLRRLKAWFTGETIVPSNWGVPIAEAALELELARREAEGLKEETEGTAEATKKTAEEQKRAAKIHAGALELVGAVGAEDMSTLQGGIAGAKSETESLNTSLEKTSSLLDEINRKQSSGGGGGGGTPAGRSGGGLMRRGLVRGGGGRLGDRIPAMLSDYEFVHRAAAVQRYGVGFMRAVNNMTFPTHLAEGYARGGLVGAPRHRFAGGTAAAGSMARAERGFTLVIGGQEFTGLRAPAQTADELVRYSREQQMRATGIMPSWVR